MPVELMTNEEYAEYKRRQTAILAVPPTDRSWIDCQRGSLPTKHELEAFLAVVRHSSEKEAAFQLGIATNTLTNTLTRLYTRIGARNRTHAAYLLYFRLSLYFIIDEEYLEGG